VLKPSGWLCARTPNAMGYVGIANRLVPNGLHAWVLRLLQPDREEQDVFPTHYRMNTISRLRSLLCEPEWQLCLYTYEPEPGYAGGSIAPWGGQRDT